MVISKISDGTTDHEFTFQSLNVKQSIPGDATFEAPTENYTLDIENVEGMVTKTATVTGMLISIPSGDSATVKLFSLMNFLRLNSDTLLTLTIYLDGGVLIKTWQGKIKGDIVSGVDAQRPADLLFTFVFALTGASW